MRNPLQMQLKSFNINLIIILFIVSLFCYEKVYSTDLDRTVIRAFYVSRVEIIAGGAESYKLVRLVELLIMLGGSSLVRNPL